MFGEGTMMIKELLLLLLLLMLMLLLVLEALSVPAR